IEGAAAWVEGRRYAVDMCWVADGYEDIGRRTVEVFARAPSALSRTVFAWALFPEDGPDVAQTCNGELTVNVYAIWGDDEVAADGENEQGPRDLMAAYERWATGFYAGEADLSVSADRAERAYPPNKWARLQGIRRDYDPERLKVGYISEP